jgi:hypothetical protein
LIPRHSVHSTTFRRGDATDERCGSAQTRAMTANQRDATTRTVRHTRIRVPCAKRPFLTPCFVPGTLIVRRPPTLPTSLPPVAIVTQPRKPASTHRPPFPTRRHRDIDSRRRSGIQHVRMCGQDVHVHRLNAKRSPTRQSALAKRAQPRAQPLAAQRRSGNVGVGMIRERMARQVRHGGIWIYKVNE